MNYSYIALNALMIKRDDIQEVNNMTTKRIGSRIISVMLTLAILFTILPLTAFSAFAAKLDSNRAADPSTMDAWKDLFPTTGEISTENAGGVWMDKSVFTDASEFAGLGITQDDPDSFLVALSAIAANMSIMGMSNIPTDTMFVLDVSGSMNDNPSNNDVAEELVEAANESIATLLATNKYNRVGVVLYSGPTTQGGNASANDAVLVLPLNRYTPASNGEFLSYSVTAGNKNNNTETVSLNNGVRIEGTNRAPSSASKTVVGGTYIQKGVILAMNQFIAENNSITVEDPTMGTLRRKPIMVLMSDGAPTVGSTSFTSPTSINIGDGTYTDASLGFVSQLSASYAKAMIEEKYEDDALFYTLGLGLGDDGVAIGVLDPSNANASTALDDFWNDRRTSWWQDGFEGYNHVDVGDTVSLGDGLSVRKISTALEQNYVDQYFSADSERLPNGTVITLQDKLKQAFADIVSAIQLQSGYFPTLVSESEDLSGYISFVDKIGQYMSVTDIKGILIDDHLFSGADLASNFVSGGGALGTYDNPSALGMEMVAAVRARLGLDSDETARTLIGLAYENGQLSYTNANNYSNYIGWYANAAGEFLGFYHEGVTVLPAATGNASTDPAFIVRSYGYLGAVDESHGVTESDMMYATVQVRKEIATGEELVTFAVPAALIPVVSYNVTLDEAGELSDLTVDGADNPIRLVYEVALDDSINSFNIMDVVSAEYLADPHNVNEDGTVNFYTNQWEHENITGYGTINTYSYFNPSRQNDKYYYLEDAPIYTNRNGTLYNGAAQPSADDTLYRTYKVYKNNGRLRTETIYRELSDAAKATAIRKNDGTWYIPKGNVHVNLDGYTVDKSENLTGTLAQSNMPFVDTHNHSINDAGHNFYVGATLGNNGKITVAPETGIKLTKTMAAGADKPTEPFSFTLYNESDNNDNGSYPAWLISADGRETEFEVNFDSGSATVRLNPNDVLYIGGMEAGHSFRVVEEETAEYTVSSVSGLSASGTVTVSENRIASVSFVNDNRGAGDLTVAKEVEHGFGLNYQIPADKVFTMQVTLNGIGTANATFKAEHTNGRYSNITTDANGRFTVELKHDEQFEVFGLPAGTVATVVEQTPPEGFTPAYWDNGSIGDGVVTVVDGNTVSVIVVNDYEATEVYPVNITVGGNKTLNGRAWQQGDSFLFKLEKLLADGSWQQLGNTAEVYYGKTSFSFADAFENERYNQTGTYYYRVVEIEPENPIGGISYDKTVHSFSVIVTDSDMDGQLEISEVRTDRPLNTEITENSDGWEVFAKFTNTYSTAGTATVTIDVNKNIKNNGGSAKSLAGYVFGLFDSTTNEQVGEFLTTTERGFARFVLNYNASEIGNGNKTYNYILKEIAPETVPEGWTYSTEEIPVTVKITDNGDGTISAVIYTESEQPANAGTSISTTFTNTYDPTDTELAIDFVSKQLNGRDLANGEFTFEVQTQNGATLLKGSNDAAGKVTFDDTLKFDEVGTYFYNIVETSTDGKGVVTDKTTYRVTVNVTDVNGRLTASYVLVNATGNTITFKNTYTTTPAEHTIVGTKTLRGRTLINDEFTFVLTELTVNGTAIQNAKVWTVKNRSTAEDNIVFPTISYNAAGTYTYSVEEVLPEGGSAYGITYDTTKYKVTVIVRDNGEGALEIASETVTLLNNTPASSLSFLNYYEAKGTTAQFSGEKQLTGKVNNALQGGEFEFELYASDETRALGSLIETVENEAGGSFYFSEIDFENDGDQFFIVKEKNGGETIEGITYDDTVYYVWVEVTDDLKGQLHAKVHLYNNEGVPQDKILFVNIYTITGDDTITLSGEKIIDGRDFMEGDSFTFELYEADENYNPAETPKLTVNMDTATKKYSIDLEYTAEDAGKTFYYVLKEQNAGQTVNGIVYSEAVYEIEVKVEDNGVGGIKTTVTVENATTSTLNFVNEYKIVSGTSAQFEATKELNGKELSGLNFGFNLIESNANWESLNLLQNKANNGTEILFDEISYTEAGDYYYLVAEQNGGQTIDGITYDDTVYRIHVKVTDNLDGTLSRTIVITDDNGEETAIVFVNEYNVTGTDSIELSGEKTFNGRDWTENDVFVIEMYAADENFENLGTEPITSGEADPETGKFTLVSTYGVDDIGNTFHYVVKEKNAGQKISGITYSATVYEVTVTVSDNGDGTVDATATVSGVENNALNFTNEYAANKTSIEFAGTKTLNNINGIRELKENDFSFDLYNATENFEIDGTAIQSVKNNEDGEFAFDAVDFNEDGIYRFIIKENSQAPIGGVVYDNTQYHITVTVSDNGQGEFEIIENIILKVNGETSEETEAIEFVNEYNAESTNVTIQGVKTLNGRELLEGEFRFLMYEADESFAILENANAIVALNGADGNFTFDALSFTDAGIYFFVICEDSGVEAERVSFDNSVYLVTIEVTDDENGKLIASALEIVKQDINDAVETIEFTNVFVPKPADITVDIDILKTVVNKGTESITPEGFEFLLYDGAKTLTVKSDANGKARFTLTFTEDDIGKNFSYTLTEVNDGKANVTYSTAEYAITVTVSLDEENNTLVAVATLNGESAETLTAEFENVYDYTPEIPQTGDNFNMFIWIAMLIISGGAAITLFEYDKKKRTQESL